MSAVLEELRSGYPAYESLGHYDKVRLIRQYAFARIVLASTPENHLTTSVLKTPLPDVFRAFDRNEGGVWCSGAAVILMRLYIDAGYRAWKYDYGAGSPVSHSATLVEVDGDVYLQDAYFNTDYVHEDGQPFPFFDVLQRLKDRRPPILRQHRGHRRGLFVSEANAREWVGSEAPAAVPVTLAPGRILCQFPMTFAGYLAGYFESPKVAAWLAAAGYPNDWSYLLLHPLPAQRFLSVRDAPGRPLKPDRRMALSIMRAVCARPTDRSVHVSDPDGESPVSDASILKRLEYLNDRVDELQLEIVRLVDQIAELHENNQRLKGKLARVRAKLARSREASSGAER